MFYFIQVDLVDEKRFEGLEQDKYGLIPSTKSKAEKEFGILLNKGGCSLIDYHFELKLIGDFDKMFQQLKQDF